MGRRARINVVAPVDLFKSRFTVRLQVIASRGPRHRSMLVQGGAVRHVWMRARGWTLRDDWTRARGNRQGRQRLAVGGRWRGGLRVGGADRSEDSGSRN